VLGYNRHRSMTQSRRVVRLFGPFLILLCLGGLRSTAERPCPQIEFPLLSGPYLGQESPGENPGIFALGIVCTGRYVLNAVFFPDLKEFYFSTMDSDKNYTILQMREIEGRWTRPRIAPFSGNFSDADPFITPDGKNLLFPSDRPLSEGGDRADGYNIWVVDRTGSGWTDPRPLGPQVNLPGGIEIYPSVTRDRTLYFSSDREGGRGSSDIFRARYVNGKYAEPENLGKAINTPDREFDAFIAPDEAYLIFSSYRLRNGFGKSDLYISFRSGNGKWTPAINMGELINSRESEFSPMVSPDGKYLFFTSTRLGQGDIYWVDATVLDRYRNRKEGP
jgi:Tol biopolymer transport system component